MSRRKTFNTNQVLGITKAKRNLARITRIPTTESGRKRKFNKIVRGGLLGAEVTTSQASKSNTTPNNSNPRNLNNIELPQTRTSKFKFHTPISANILYLVSFLLILLFIHLFFFTSPISKILEIFGLGATILSLLASIFICLVVGLIIETKSQNRQYEAALLEKEEREQCKITHPKSQSNRSEEVATENRPPQGVSVEAAEDITVDNDLIESRNMSTKIYLPKIFQGLTLKYRYDRVYVAGCRHRDTYHVTLSDSVELIQEPDNEYDVNAIAVHVNQVKIGYVKKGRLQEIVSDFMKYNKKIVGFISEFEGSDVYMTLGFYKFEDNTSEKLL